MQQKLDNLENTGMIDVMYHQWERYKSIHPLQISRISLWAKWIRS